ncbi:type II toxin-antitoxin system VapC family toxin [Longimicrobium sp.]|uniref:type II toxin-antitoxin system VapC family toxin n=1 Tax=Longimicrobium sp. TaxID=2029185 RepID=UPI002C790C90|nr:type II toxin-antitoxin system VapC family toxin [Longimicrobium sp.]HSU14848.1 type II toxin-antitoxin system VapC family toxin [Longimicrobium sp.]
MIFLDASAMVKVYVTEQGSSTLKGVLARMRGKLFLSPHVIIEVLSTFAKQHRSDVITKTLYRKARSGFLNDIGETYTVMEVGAPVFWSAYDLVDRHRQFSVGALDVLHVASALKLQASFRRKTVVLATADRGLLSLARAAGVKTFNPVLDPLAVLLASVN